MRGLCFAAASSSSPPSPHVSRLLMLPPPRPPLGQHLPSPDPCHDLHLHPTQPIHPQYQPASSPPPSFRPLQRIRACPASWHSLFLLISLLCLGPFSVLPTHAQLVPASTTALDTATAANPTTAALNPTSTQVVIPSPSSQPYPSNPLPSSHQGITTLTDYHFDSPKCNDSGHPYRVSLITHATTLTGDDTKLDAKAFIPMTLTDVLSGVDYDAERMSAAIYDAVNYPVDALIVSIPDYDVLKAPILAARDKGIPVIAVYTGLQAAKDMGILAVMSDEV
ncbi:hypothetical protein EDD21DRAFT_186721 [Dissophora ornata]|nr:hypothetical protein EDD21DRAFT_186721 [Dissophora ornata]